MRRTGQCGKETNRQVRRPPHPLDTQLSLLSHRLEGGADEVGELGSLQQRLQPLTGLSSGAYAGRGSTTSHCRWVLSQACMARLPWADSPSHNRVALSPPRKRRSSASTWIRLSVLSLPGWRWKARLAPPPLTP